MEIIYDSGEIHDSSTVYVDLYSSKADKTIESCMRLAGAVDIDGYPDTLGITNDLMTHRDFVDLMRSQGLKVYSMLKESHPNYSKVKEYYQLDDYTDI
jgi:hypothetical protein